VTVVATPANEQVEKIKKVYDKKMSNLDRQLSQEVKRHQSEEKQMKYIITQLVNQKQELEEKLAKTTPSTKPTAPSTKPPTLLTKPPTPLTKPSAPSKPTVTKSSASSSSTLKKPNPTSAKSNVKYTPVNHSKEALTLKSPSYIKFNQIQIEKIETEIFNTPIPRKRDNIQREIIEINNLKINTPSPRPNEIKITFSTPEPLLQTVFVTSKPLPHTLLADSLLIKKKHLGLSKPKNTDNTSVFTFEKPFTTNPPEYKGIEKPKEVIKKNKPLNKSIEILEFLFDQKLDNNNNNKSKPNISNNEDIYNPKNMKYTTPPITLSQILVSDSQVIVPNSTSSSHSSPYVTLSSSPTIHSSIVDSNTTT
jgi:hypothetical protein